MCRASILSEKKYIYNFDGWKTLNIVRKCSILDVAEVLHILLLKNKRKQKKDENGMYLVIYKILIRILQLH